MRYVLLFGDIGTIPTEERQRPGTSAAPQFDTTDYYYFTHRDAEGGECLLPWIAGGRIAAVTTEEGGAVVDQIIRYEKDPPGDPAYYSRMTVAAYFEDGDDKGRQDGRANKAYLKTMETIREHMVSHGFEVNRVYVSNTRAPEQYSDGTPVPPEVKEDLIYKTDAPIATKKLIGLTNESGVARLSIEPGIHYLELRVQDSVVLDQQILADGGHVSRNAEVLCNLLALLMPLRDSLQAAYLEVPEPINAAIERMLPMLRLMQHGDGRLAVFQGVSRTCAGAIKAILERDKIGGRPVSHASQSGFARLAHGHTTLVMDTGQPAAVPFAPAGQPGQRRGDPARRGAGDAFFRKRL